MSRRITKQNGVSALIHKKPYDCLYEKKSIKAKFDYWNQICNDVLEVIPDEKSYLLIEYLLIDMNQRKESLELQLLRTQQQKNKSM